MKTNRITRISLLLVVANLTGCTTTQKLTVENHYTKECRIAAWEGEGTLFEGGVSLHSRPLRPGRTAVVQYGNCRTTGLQLPFIGGFSMKKGMHASLPVTTINGNTEGWQLPEEADAQAQRWFDASWFSQKMQKEAPGRMVILRSGKPVWRTKNGDTPLKPKD